MKRHKSIHDKNGNVVGIQHFDDDDEPPMMPPYFADNSIKRFDMPCSIGHPLGVKFEEYGVKASPLGVCIGHRDRPFLHFDEPEYLLRQLNEFNALIYKLSPNKSNLEGRDFQIAGVKQGYESTTFERIICVSILCTEAIFAYLRGKWEFVITGSADIVYIEEIKTITNLNLTGIGVYNPMDNNAQGQLIKLVEYV